jgi:hypothetical protein
MTTGPTKQSSQLGFVVTAAPGDGRAECQGTWSLVAGRVVGSVPGLLVEVDATITVPYDDARALSAGDLDPSVAFMQGRLKSAGDTGTVLDFLAGTAATDGAAEFREHLAALIDNG